MSDALVFIAAAGVTLTLVLTFAEPAAAKGGAKKPENYAFQFEGPFGFYDRAAMQRGYQVYKQVCAACHSMDLVAFRHLGQKGAPFYAPDFPNPIDSPYIAELARRFGEDVRFVTALDEGGLPLDCNVAPTPSACVPGPSSYIPGPYRNDLQAAAVNGGAVPPDFSTIVKARKGGPEYIRSMLLGYVDIPEGLEVPPGQYYNQYYEGDLAGNWSGDPSQVPKGGLIAMAGINQLAGWSTIEYMDGTPATDEQKATDVAYFLTWASHPDMEARKNLGRQVVVYLAILSILLWFSYKQIWRNVKK